MTPVNLTVHDFKFVNKALEQANTSSPVSRTRRCSSTIRERPNFTALKRAYVEARYSEKCRVTAEDLSQLGDRVRDLGSVVDRACREQITTLTAEAPVVGQITHSSADRCALVTRDLIPQDI
jgi:hypothetical protein